MILAGEGWIRGPTGGAVGGSGRLIGLVDIVLIYSVINQQALRRTTQFQELCLPPANKLSVRKLHGSLKGFGFLLHNQECTSRACARRLALDG